MGMLKPVTFFVIDPIANGCDQMLSVDELTALSIYLVAAYHSEDIKPLWLGKHGVFAQRDGQTIKLKGMGGAMSLDSTLKFLATIEDQARYDGKLHGAMYPDVHDYNRRSNESGVRLEDELLAYRDEEGYSYLPIALRYTGDMDVWYGVKGTQEDFANLMFCTRYKFDNLTLGQI